MSSRAMRIKRIKRTHAPLFIVLACVLSFFGLCVAAAVGLVQECNIWLEDLPEYSDISDFQISGPTRIYAADQTTLLAELSQANRQPVEIKDVSEWVFKATVCVEDIRFFDHKGVDPQGILRALFVNLGSGGTEEGASTITQQLVRNTLLIDEMSERTLRRKVREAYLALQVEKVFSKDEILMMYLNSVNYGDGAYGIEAAAQHYFDKSAKDLTLSESAMLAGIPQAPTRLNPAVNYDAAMSRRNTVLKRMRTNKVITGKQYKNAKKEKVDLDIQESPQSDSGAYPYFIEYVKSSLSDSFSSEQLYRGGLTIYTTLDIDKQKAADEACRSAVSGQAEDYEVALCSIDPDNGHVVAMWGGKDFDEDQFNLATQASRQCGSSFKAFTLATAIENGISPETVYSGKSPLKVSSTWTVRNDSNASYGDITISQATRLSLNTVFVQLIRDIGSDKVVDVAHRMGISSELEAVDSITLGTQGVNPLEMASAFGTFATGGIHHDTVCVTRILDSSGRIVYDDDGSSSEAISKEVAHAATEVLIGDVTSGTATSAQLSSGQESAGKTGTTQNYRDAYYVGYTPQLSTAVWAGTRAEREVYYNGSAIHGGSACCPVWNRYTSAALENEPLEKFPEADIPDYRTDFTPDTSAYTFGSTSGSESQGEQ